MGHSWDLTRRCLGRQAGVPFSTLRLEAHVHILAEAEAGELWKLWIVNATRVVEAPGIFPLVQ